MNYSKLMEWSRPLSAYAALSGGVNAFGGMGRDFGRMGRGFGSSSGGGGSPVVPAVLSSPLVTAFTNVTADLSVSTTAGSGTLYWVIDTSATPPSAAQVKTGQGSGGGAAASSGSQAVVGTGVQTKTGAAGFSENTTYYAYFMQETTVQSTVAASAAFTTYLTAAQTLFNAITTPPTTTRKGLYNTYILSLMSAGVWTLLDVDYFLAAADNQAARLNIKNPATFTASPINSPSFTVDRGYTGDGATSYLNTGFTPSTAGGNASLNSMGIGIWNQTEGIMTAGDLGSVSAGTIFLVSRFTGNVVLARLNDATSSSVSNSLAVGFIGVNRSASNARQFYRNGASIGSDAAASTTLSAQPITILRNQSGFSTRQISSKWITGSLDATQTAALYNAKLAFLQAIGAA